MLILGYDPGGVGKNGVAIADFRGAEPVVTTATKNCVDDAVAWFMEQSDGAIPNGIGIDTMLSWATVKSGWRPMDRWLQDRYPDVRNSVFSSNSSRGSMAVQGMALAMRLRDAEGWPRINVNETHPKVLYYAQSGDKYAFGEAGKTMRDWLANQMGLSECAVENEHEWDALISAWATRQGLTGAWKTDLMHDDEGLLLPAGKPTYYWPTQP